MIPYISESNIELNFTAYDIVCGDDGAITYEIAPLTDVQAIQFVIKQTAAGAALVTKTLDDDVSVVSESGGTFKVELAPADTADFDGDYIAEIKITDSNSKISFFRQKRGYLLAMPFNKNIID